MVEPIGFQKWPSIDQLKNVVYFWNKVELFKQYGVMFSYQPKPKLHGTNAAIRFYQNDDFIVGDDRVAPRDYKFLNNSGEAVTLVAQSRNRDIFVGDDNYGFAKWVVDNEADLKDTIRLNSQVYCTTIYGEWAGEGILDGAAICQAPRGFHVFAIQEQLKDGTIISMNIDPEFIEKVLEVTCNVIREVHVLPWIGREIMLNAYNTDSIGQEINHINHMVELGDAGCEYTKHLYDIDGPLEGLVYYPTNYYWLREYGEEDPLRKLKETLGPRDWMSRLLFKAKGEKHRVTKSVTAVHIDPIEIKRRKDFLDAFCTEQRFLQGLEETKASSIEDTGKFVKWVCDDVYKESQLELEGCDLDWKYFAKHVATEASQWYRRRL